MCESTIILRKGEERNEIMKDVIKVNFENDRVICTDITGNKQELADVRIIEIDSLKHIIVLAEK